MTTANVPADELFAPLLTAAQTQLSTALHAPVRLTSPERLTEEDRRNVILRCTVTDGPPDAPASVIIKQVVADDYDPDAVDSWDIQRFFRDWAGAQFLSDLSTEAPHSPRFYGGDRALGFILLEDLGVHRSLVEPLLGDDPRYAERTLLAFAARLGQLHADTIGRAKRFERVQHALSPNHAADVQTALLQKAAELHTAADRFQAYLDRFDAPVAPQFSSELQAISDATAHPGDFLAYIHGDPCPDNLVDTNGRLRLIDFEFGHFGHALQDGVYARMLFPTCWCANQIPATVIEQIERVYRAELMRGCPAAHDDQLFETALVNMCGYWLITSSSWLMERVLDEDSTWGIATVRSRIVARLQTFIATSTTYERLPALRSAADALLERLQQRWPDVPPLAVYPAFRGSAS